MRICTRQLISLTILILLLSLENTSGGGGPQNVLVVVNDLSVESLELGQYYQEQRGVPERNICHVIVSPDLESVSWAVFSSAVVRVVNEHIETQGLSSQIDFVLLGKDIPSRVANTESATATMFYGYKNAPAIPPCSIPTNTKSFYYKAERAFSHEDIYGGDQYYLTMMLTALSMAQAKTSVNQGVMADQSSPSGRFYLFEPPGDQQRNVRYKLFDNFDFNARFRSDFPAYSIKAINAEINKSDVLGYLTGRPNHPDWFYSTNDYLPGAIADHLTSIGARFPDPEASGQDSILRWIEAGATASYGTVAEPCNYLQKFPDPMCYYWYGRGFSLAESYWMSVANPYQGLFVGEPLAAPYAIPCFVAVTNLATNEVVSGSTTIQVLASNTAAATPPQRVELFVDDLYLTNMAYILPEAGNVLYADVGGVTCSYTVVGGDTLYDAVDGLAYNINASNVEVWAYAYGDRLALVYTNYGYVGSGLTYTGGAVQGAAPFLTVRGTAATTNLLESRYVAREYISVTATNSPFTANTGDTVTCVITLTNGVVATNRVVAFNGESPASVMDRLRQVINSNVALQVTNGVYANRHGWYSVAELPLEARTPGPEGQLIHVDYTVTRAFPLWGLDPANSFSDHFNDNQDDLTARGDILFEAGTNPLTASYSWDTTAWPDGPHDLRIVAVLGDATEVQGHYIVPVIVSNNTLSCDVISPTNGQIFTLGDSVSVTATATNPSAAVTQVVFLVEGKKAAVDTAAPYSISWPTTNYGVGKVTVRAHAFDASGNEAWSEPVEVDIHMSPTLDTDADGISDWWEQKYFGGLDVYGATNNPDGDAFSNYEEFITDTDPNDGTVFFSLVDIGYNTNREVTISFLSRTSRQYATEYNDAFHTNFSAWNAASPSPFWGSGGTQTWVDDGAETPSHPSSTFQRIYRIEADLPP